MCAADLTQKLAAISAAGWITPSHAICVALSGEESKLFISPIPRLITPPFLERRSLHLFVEFFLIGGYHGIR